MQERVVNWIVRFLQPLLGDPAVLMLTIITVLVYSLQEAAWVQRQPPAGDLFPAGDRLWLFAGHIALWRGVFAALRAGHGPGDPHPGGGKYCSADR